MFGNLPHKENQIHSEGVALFYTMQVLRGTCSKFKPPKTGLLSIQEIYNAIVCRKCSVPERTVIKHALAILSTSIAFEFGSKYSGTRAPRIDVCH